MAFSIEPDVVDGYAEALKRLSDVVPTGSTYLSDHLSIGIVDSTFLFYRAATAAQDVRDSIQGLLDELGPALDASALELNAVATRSLELDDGVETELDAAYPDAEGSSASTPASNQTVYTCTRPPADALIEPAAEPESDWVSDILTTDWLSPSDIVAQLIEWVFDWNPVDEIMRRFSGDWDALYRVSSATTNISSFISCQGAGITEATGICANGWTGNAAGAAYAFFAEFASLLEDAADEIAKAGPEFETVARGMRDTADTLSGMFTLIMDLAIAAAVFYAAGTATGATVIGPIIGAIGGTGSIAYIAWLAAEAWKTLQAAELFFDSLGTAVGLLSQFMINNPELPMPTPYDNPDV